MVGNRPSVHLRYDHSDDILFCVGVGGDVADTERCSVVGGARASSALLSVGGIIIGTVLGGSD